jgi:glycosyltransferase involved in cell wall biosynthesis
MSTARGPALLCVSNYAANTGYAWDFIESLYARIADQLAVDGVRTLVAYPRIEAPPRTLEGSAATAVELDAGFQTLRSVRDTIRLMRAENVRVLYLTDRPAWSTRYALLRGGGGAGYIVVHDHASGERAIPTNLRRLLKWTAARTPLMAADAIVAVSDYVARRQIQTGLMPPDRVQRVWNGIPVPPTVVTDRRLHAAVGLAPDRPVVACACRTAPQKGVLHLLKAFDLLLDSWPADQPLPALVYMGDGPQFSEVKSLHERLRARAHIVLTGYRKDAGDLIAGADVCAMPSLWQDALPLAVAQPMAQGRPVVASAVGGIPEMIVEGETGFLVPPGDEPALADRLRTLLLDPDLAARFGRAGRERIARLFTPEGQIAALTSVVRRGLSANGVRRPD